MIRFHIGDDILLSYSAGNLDEGSSLLVATHLALCPCCRARSAAADSLGGYFLECLEETPVSPRMMDVVLSEARSDLSSASAESAADIDAEAVIPEPLRSYLGGDIHALKWKRLAPFVRQIMIETNDKRSQARLLHFQRGTMVPSHGHNGRELTLILKGSFRDGDIVLNRGDVSETDENTEHQPFVVKNEDCICLAVTDAPLRFKSRFVRLLQPLFGM